MPICLDHHAVDFEDAILGWGLGDFFKDGALGGPDGAVLISTRNLIQTRNVELTVWMRVNVCGCVHHN